MYKKSYGDSLDLFKFMVGGRTRKIEPVKCECCGSGNSPQKDCPVCGGKGVKHIITEM